MTSKKIKLVYEVIFIADGHPLLERAIEEVFMIIKDCILTSLPGEKETIEVTITKTHPPKNPLDKKN